MEKVANVLFPADYFDKGAPDGAMRGPLTEDELVSELRRGMRSAREHGAIPADRVDEMLADELGIGPAAA